MAGKAPHCAGASYLFARCEQVTGFQHKRRFVLAWHHAQV